MKYDITIIRKIFNEADCKGLYFWQFKSLVSACQYLKLYNIVAKYCRKGDKVLDWGCGNGHFSFFLLQAGYQASGYSIEQTNFVDQLRAAYEFKQGNEVINLPFDNGYFDAVVSVGVLEHVPETGGNIISSLQEISRILKPRGKFICFHLPNYYSYIEWLTSIRPGRHPHKYRFTHKMIESMLHKTSFSLINIEQYGALPRLIWNSFPINIGKSAILARSWNIMDNLLNYLMRPISQNYLFVAEKQGVDQH